MSGALRIEALDARDECAMKAWHDTFLASHRYGRPFARPLMLEELRARFTAQPADELDLAFTGLVGDEVVATGMCYLGLRDNLDRAYLEVQVHPDHRRRNHGSAMVEHLEQVAREHGRSRFGTEVVYPYTAAADGAGTGYVRFAESHGYSFGLGEVMRVLALPVDEALLRALVAEAAPHHTGYTFRQFEGPAPEELLESFAAVIGSLSTQAPTGEVEREPEVYDGARIRANEKLLAESGRTKFTTVALDGGGEVAAYSEIVLPAHDPGHAYQWGTLARPQDRGHRLGLATKARNLLWCQPRLGEATLTTYNAEVNSHMIGVNDRLGFRPVERLGEFQKLG